MSIAAAPLNATAEQLEVLQTWARSRVLPQRQVLRAKIILSARDGIANEVIATRLGCSKPTVLKWRARFEADGVDGLEEAGGRGPEICNWTDVEKYLRFIADAVEDHKESSLDWKWKPHHARC